MSVNGGGWTLFYKNNNIVEQGESYADMLGDSPAFITQSEDIDSTDVYGVSPIEGLGAVSMMAMPVGSSSYTSVNFGDSSVAEKVLDVVALNEGENAFSVDMSFKMYLLPHPSQS